MSREILRPSFGWESMIAEAQSLLPKMRDKRRIAIIRAVIKMAEESRDAGEPWPGQEIAGTEAESIPA
jgi:hypothetical protein